MKKNCNDRFERPPQKWKWKENSASACVGVINAIWAVFGLLQCATASKNNTVPKTNHSKNKPIEGKIEYTACLLHGLRCLILATDLGDGGLLPSDAKRRRHLPRGRPHQCAAASGLCPLLLVFLRCYSWGLVKSLTSSDVPATAVYVALRTVTKQMLVTVTGIAPQTLVAERRTCKRQKTWWAIARNEAFPLPVSVAASTWETPNMATAARYPRSWSKKQTCKTIAVFKEIGPKNQPDCEELMSWLSGFLFLPGPTIFFTISNPFSSISVSFWASHRSESVVLGEVNAISKKQKQT